MDKIIYSAFLVIVWIIIAILNTKVAKDKVTYPI